MNERELSSLHIFVPNAGWLGWKETGGTHRIEGAGMFKLTNPVVIIDYHEYDH